MRTTLNIDGKLMRSAMKATGTTTKTATVERGLIELIRRNRRRNLVESAGKGYGMTLKEFLSYRDEE